MNSGGATMSKELLDFFDFNKNTPSVSAFTQQRSKVLPEAFEYLFKSFTDDNLPTTNNYHGYRLIACDGSNLTIATNQKDPETFWERNQEIAEKVGDFYMLPSSIHETLIVPKDAGMEFKELEQMVQEVNQTQVAPGERLSDHVYEYDAKEHELFRSDRAEERAKQKEEKRDNRHERVSVKEKLAEKKDAVIKMNAGKEHSAPEKKKEAVI